MSGLVSYSYDPSSEQEQSDASNEYQLEKKDETEKQRKPDLDRLRERDRSRDSNSRRDREERPTRRRHHKHRRHSSNSESPERERRSHRRSPNRRSRSPRHRDRSYRSRRERTPPRAITSARSPPRDSRSGMQHCPGYSRQEGASLTPEQKLEMALTAMNSGTSVQPGNPYGMSKEKFKSLQNKKKMLWSKDEEEDSTVRNTGSVYMAATSSLPVNQEKKDRFSKMMGLKSPGEFQAPSLPTQDLVKYDKTQEDLQKQYDASRVHTHMMKGSGLGYGNYYQVN